MDEFDLPSLYWRGEETGDYSFPRDAIIMQFTGLLDKNGKEIYEGDIVERTTRVLEVVRETGIVNWKDSGLYIGASNFPIGIYRPEHLRIIGNIYENPELFQ